MLRMLRLRRGDWPTRRSRGEQQGSGLPSTRPGAIRGPTQDSSAPDHGCREPFGLVPTMQWSPGQPSPFSVGWEPSPPGASVVVLAGRATTVPFTAALNGPQRTTTDNHEAASTCAVPHPPMWQQRPIWLCKQGVVGSSPIISTTFRPGRARVHRNTSEPSVWRARGNATQVAATRPGAASANQDGQARSHRSGYPAADG